MTTSKFADDVQELMGYLGASLVAVIGSQKSTAVVRNWIKEKSTPDTIIQEKIHVALTVSRFLAKNGEQDVIHAWFVGMNLDFEDNAPALVIEQATSETLSSVTEKLLQSAQAFSWM